MKKSTIEKIDVFFKNNPIAKGKSSTLEDISNAEKRLGLIFDEDYTYFILNYGGSMIKNKEIYGFHNSELMDDTDIIALTESYREEEENEDRNWLIIGTDYSGNYIGITEKGEVSVYDFDIGELYILGTSFEDYVLKALDS